MRGIQRPKYGYYLDHIVDAIATAAIGLGLGLSPFMLLSIGALIVVGYLILSINVYLESMLPARLRLPRADRDPRGSDPAQHRAGAGAGPRLRHPRAEDDRL